MRGRVCAAISGLLLLLSQVATNAQQPTFKSATELVSLNVTVTGANAKSVDGLTQEHFEVFEDGVRQKLMFFASGEMPLDVILLLDTSASMAGSLVLVQNAAMRLITALRPEDRASVMGISDGLRVLHSFSGDRVSLERAVRATKAAGRTLLYASIYTALRELDKVRKAYEVPRRQAIVVLSDGQDTASGFGFDELMRTVHRQAVPIYTVAPRPSATVKAQREAIFGETTHEQDFELRKLAAETGARAFFPASLHELAGVYDDIANELANQYSLGYHSTNETLDGSFRRIALRVTAPGAKWRARAGYLAVADSASAGGELR